MARKAEHLPSGELARNADDDKGDENMSNHSTHDRTGPTVTTGLIVRLQAKPGEEEELASFLEGALPVVGSEPQTIAWLAVRASDSSFAIVDAFPDEAGRQAHLDGPLAAALLSRAAELLAEPPEIYPVEVLAAKLPTTGGREAGA